MSDSNVLLGDQLLPSTSQKGWNVKKKIGLVVMIICVVGLLTAAIIIGIASKNSQRGFHRAVNVDAIMEHLKNFEKAANLPANKGSRGVLEGYDDTVAYVMEQLSKKTDCIIERDYFSVPVFYNLEQPVLKLTGPIERNFQFKVDYTFLSYAGDGFHNITKPVTFVNGGCNSADFESFPEGNICLLEHNAKDCPNFQKGLNCQKAKASAILLYNNYDRTILGGGLRNSSYYEGDPLVLIPSFSTSFSFGSTIKQLENPVVNMISNTSIIFANTSNIYCTTKDGDKNNTIVAGAHLDSVPAGPGINDNGSGSASLLEIIIQFYKTKVKPTNKVVFAFWGAEELGLIGSRYYANKLQKNHPDEFKNLAMALNFDMLGSPNYIPYTNVFEGSPGLPESIRNGSNVITRTFGEYFDEASVAYQTTIMSGGSDYYSFAERGIPAGGLETGAGSIKNATERTLYGGFANAPYDPCYHQYCDTTENINLKGLEIMSQGAAYAVHKFSTMKNVRETLKKG